MGFTYVIGDVQGCLAALQALLVKLNYHPEHDTLWFTGDLINRGPQSLETLRFISKLPATTVSVLGNHDLTLLAAHVGAITPNPKDTYREILLAPDKEELIDWLRHRPLLHHDSRLGYTLTHAGIYPLWDLSQAMKSAKEVEHDLQGPDFKALLMHMYGNHPSFWDESLTGWDRARFVINAFTRMRFCTSRGELDFSSKGSLNDYTQSIPWFSFPGRRTQQHKLLFGHWAALNGQCSEERVFALDTGCVWGNCLTGFCLETEKRVSIACQKYLEPIPLEANPR